MNDDTPDPRREIAASRERLTSLTAAILRVSGSLDVETVMRETAEAARALTGARYAAITTVDGDGQLEHLAVSGPTEAERKRMRRWTDRARIFERLRGMSSPLRVADMPAYLSSLGLSADGAFFKAFLGTAMRHRGTLIGDFLLGGDDTPEQFGDEDEELLTAFAAQAAAAVANARTHHAERRARANLEALAETSPVGVLLFDSNGRPTWINREARRLAGALGTADQPPEALLETAMCRFADGRETALDALGVMLGQAAPVRAEEIEVSVPDGRSISVLANSTPIFGEDEALVSLVVTVQDLAPIRELERLRADFLGMVSHELRAPLASIMGSAATLLDDDAAIDPAERREFHRIIHDQAVSMRRLVGDLLDAGRIEAGTLSVSTEPSDVVGLIDQARSTFLSGGGRHAVLIDVPQDLPQVMADRRRIVQVLTNLLANAARHSPESAPIHIEAERDGGHVALSVADEGTGVPPEQLPRLFRRYARGHEFSGTGLGLLICRGLVEAHGGRIRAESDGDGRGARFTFTVPAAADVAEHRPAGPGNAAPRAREPARVLVVDDDPQALRFTRDALGAAGYAPVVTGDPAELSSTILKAKPDLVLLDLVLPGADGIELMKTTPELSGLPVVFISAYGRDETVAEALRAGAVDYIVKPFSPTELAARIAAALRRTSHPEPFALGDLAIRYEERRVTVAGRDIDLTATEYQLLRALSLGAGRVVPFGALMREVWPDRETGDFGLVRNFVKKLRAKLGDAASAPTWIFSVRGVGYRMPDPHGDPRSLSEER